MAEYNKVVISNSALALQDPYDDTVLHLTAGEHPVVLLQIADLASGNSLATVEIVPEHAAQLIIWLTARLYDLGLQNLLGATAQND